MNLNDKTDIEGIHNMIRSDDISSEADLKDIENRIVNGELYVDDNNARQSASQIYDETMNQLLRGTMQSENKSPEIYPVNINVESDNSSIGRRSERRSEHRSEHRSERRSNYSRPSHRAESREFESVRNDDTYAQPETGRYQQRTREEERSAALKQFLKTDEVNDNDNNDKFELEHEKLADDKVIMIEQIESLKDELRLDKNDKRFAIDEDDDYNKVRATWERLKYKSQLQTYDTMFTEAIIFGTGMIEKLFDGKKVYFGYRPNMEGWSDTVKLKLKRMQPEKTKVVSGIVKNYQINEGASIVIQLILSGILYSQFKGKEAEEENYGERTSHGEWKRAVNDMDD